MNVTQHINVQTRTGYAQITLNQGKLLITYYSHHLAVDYAIVDMQQDDAIYRDGWNLDNLQKVVRTCEPKTPYHSK